MVGAADKDPPALSATALVGRIKVKDANGDHEHEGVTLWGLKECESTLELKPRLLREPKHYIDVKHSWPNELQDPHFYIVNPDAPPARSLPVYPQGCTSTTSENAIYSKPKFVFAFAIAEIRNNAGAQEAVSPHLLVYLPLQTGGNLQLGIMGEFELQLMHMGSSDKYCDTVPSDEQEHCIALVRLREFWDKNKKDDQKVIARVESDIDQLLIGRKGLSLAEVPPPLGFQAGDDIVQIRYHNGVIHGIVKGG